MFTRGEDELGPNRVGIGRISLELNPQPVVAGLGIVSIQIGWPLDAGSDQIQITITVHIGRGQAPSHNALGEITGEPPKVEISGAAAAPQCQKISPGCRYGTPTSPLKSLGVIS